VRLRLCQRVQVAHAGLLQCERPPSPPPGTPSTAPAASGVDSRARRAQEDMGVPVRIVPDYETLECRFKFGLTPDEDEEATARRVACFSACPSAGELRGQCGKMGERGDAKGDAARMAGATRDARALRTPRETADEGVTVTE
jgi:hypothetical protein